jgi:hypothetical protein
VTMGVEKEIDFVPALRKSQKKERITLLSRTLYPNHVAGLINWYVGTSPNVIDALYNEISAHATEQGIYVITNDDGFLEIQVRKPHTDA